MYTLFISGWLFMYVCLSVSHIYPLFICPSVYVCLYVSFSLVLLSLAESFYRSFSLFDFHTGSVSRSVSFFLSFFLSFFSLSHSLSACLSLSLTISIYLFLSLTLLHLLHICF